MFATDDSNKIVGTDASQSGEIPMDGEYTQVFIDDLYRSTNLKFVDIVDDFHSLPLRRYGIDPKDLLSAKSLPSQGECRGAKRIFFANREECYHCRARDVAQFELTFSHRLGEQPISTSLRSTEWRT